MSVTAAWKVGLGGRQLVGRGVARWRLANKEVLTAGRASGGDVGWQDRRAERHDGAEIADTQQAGLHDRQSVHTVCEMGVAVCSRRSGLDKR